MPYPAFIDSDTLPDTFLAVLPGVRAKPYAHDIRRGTFSGRVDLPPEWRGTTGGAPGKSLEIFVLAGELRLSDIDLGPGGYAYLPPGGLGFRLEVPAGARILYFLDEPDPSAVIRAPLILNSDRLSWEERGDGSSLRMLRDDPGSGARTWLVRIEPGASVPWQLSSVMREGYLVGGAMTWSECVAGEAVTGNYTPGGYFRRPASRINGGPDAAAQSVSTWFYREQERGSVDLADGCETP